MSLISISGFIALITYITTLLPSNLNKVFPHLKKNSLVKLLSRNRRNTGLLSFFFASIHSAITVSHLNINLFELNTYSVYYTGTFSFAIFTVLALTSNNFSIKKLKKNWKKLHNFTYVAMVLLLIHIWSLMGDKWTIFTGFGLCFLSAIATIYIARLYRDLNKKSARQLLVD